MSEQLWSTVGHHPAPAWVSYCECFWGFCHLRRCKSVRLCLWWNKLRRCLWQWSSALRRFFLLAPDEKKQCFSTSLSSITEDAAAGAPAPRDGFLWRFLLICLRALSPHAVFLCHTHTPWLYSSFLLPFAVSSSFGEDLRVIHGQSTFVLMSCLKI